ncbi:hypothetical protein GAO09_23320 [Rhizobiales bacterium RZME27]|uniref:Secreted protein n=1 Tax=Endobacterium cereale TaxID=2663029 RepID=A0A6A8AGN8_9HYPH|nr:hypothetical protein [Endobacterium cereale]MEB2845402.1 hypothetical protein [Endobacterium cereale]MQY48967.1 hypothetical protein [Endobacterium cereale]
MPVSRLKTLTFLAGATAPALVLMLAAAPGAAQTSAPGTPPSTQSLESNVACNAAGEAEAATPADTDSAAGTAPGNTGSTGWTGGTGGQHTSTNPQGALPESKTWQPPTARGLDLTMPMPKSEPDKTTANC